jgi:hypothetical protein
MVREYSRLTFKFSRDYDKEIKEIRDDIKAYDDKFYDVKTVSTQQIKKPMSPQKFAKTLEAFKSMTPKPSKKQIKQFEKSLLDEFEGRIPEEPSFEIKQRKDWEDFLNKLYKPSKSLQEINEELAQLRKKHKKELKQIKKLKDKTKLYELTSEHKNEELKLWNSLTKPKLSVDDRNTRMQEFIEKQMEERREYLGLNVVVKTQAEKDKRKEDLKNLKEKITRLNMQRKDEITHFGLVINKISAVYWKRVSSMIYSIARSVKNPTHQNIRETIIKAELLNSKANLDCVNILEKLDDKFENCIASAIANILVGIKGFKYQYGEEIPFGNHDIDLAVSTILGIKEKAKTKPQEKEYIIDVDAEDGDGEIDIQKEMQKPKEDAEEREILSENFDEDMEFEADIEERETDYAEGPMDDEDYASDFGFSRFSMKKPSTKKEAIRTILSEISKQTVSDDIVEHFIRAIDLIKTSNIPDRIKVNRVNFFATLA